jgi:hypothetical protein
LDNLRHGLVGSLVDLLGGHVGRVYGCHVAGIVGIARRMVTAVSGRYRSIKSQQQDVLASHGCENVYYSTQKPRLASCILHMPPMRQ